MTVWLSCPTAGGWPSGPGSGVRARRRGRSGSSTTAEASRPSTACGARSSGRASHPTGAAWPGSRRRSRSGSGTGRPGNCSGSSTPRWACSPTTPAWPSAPTAVDSRSPSGERATLWDVETGAVLGSWKLPGGLCDKLAFEGPDRLRLLRSETKSGRVPPTSGYHSKEHPRVLRLRRLTVPDRMEVVREIDDFNIARLWRRGHSRWLDLRGRGPRRHRGRNRLPVVQGLRRRDGAGAVVRPGSVQVRRRRFQDRPGRPRPVAR